MTTKNPLDTDEEVPLEERFPYSEEPCPKCNRKTVMVSYGLAGGGMGTYWFCDTPDCDYFHKEQDKDDE